MTEQAPGAHDDKPIPAGIAEAAARARLGERRASYPGAQSKGRSLGCFVSAMVVLGLIAVGVVVAGGGIAAIIPGALMVVAIINWRMVTSQSKKNQDLRLDLYERGLTAVIDGRVHLVRYDTTEVLQEHIRRTGTLEHYTFAYTLTDVDGQTVVLGGFTDWQGEGEVAEHGHFSNPREWGPAIQRAVTDAQLPTAIATLNAGGRLEFGDLWLTVQEVGSARASAQWREIEEIMVRDGTVWFQVTGKRRSPISKAVKSVPNFFVFHTLAEHLLRSQR